MSIIKTIQKLEKHWALWTTLYSRRARNKKSKLIKTNDKHGLEKNKFSVTLLSHHDFRKVPDAKVRMLNILVNHSHILPIVTNTLT